MKFYIIIIGAVLLWAFALSYSLLSIKKSSDKGNAVSLTTLPMKLTSIAFTNKGSIPSKYTCDGEGDNPPLTISSVPSKAESLALIMEDPDVPTSIREDGMWDHWVMWSIPIEIKEIQEGGLPPGTVGLNTGMDNEYYPPCPPDREHRYFFKLYALDTTLQLDSQSTKHDLLKAMEGHILDEAVLMGRYVRKK